MISIRLTGQSERLNDDNLYPEEFRDGARPLHHQVRTARAGDADIVINTYNTGTGKTRAALLRLLEAVRNDGRRQRNCLLIAPTNELLHQHAGDAEAFVERNHLPHSVIRIDAPTVRAMAFPELSRPGSKLHSVLENPRILTGVEERRPIILVVNPDIFYCALYFQYGRHDQRNLSLDFLKMFGTVIIDEFHYYNAKQFANFLFFFAISKEQGYFDDPGVRRQIVLLSATPNARVRAHLERLNLRCAWIEPDPVRQENVSTTPALGPVMLEVLPAGDYPAGVADLVEKRSREIVEWIRDGRHGAVISDALWRINAAYGMLRGPLGDRVGRLTGAENRESRAAARLRDLLMATPTVDIGYNFERQRKTWQSLDFLLFDCRTADQLLQRLGRAARVLGKLITDRASTVIAIVPDALYEQLRPHADTEMDRAAFAEIVRGALPAQHELEHYIANCAINETMLPLVQLEKMGGKDIRDDLEALFDSVYRIYAPAGGRTYEGVALGINRLLAHQQIYGYPAEARERALCKAFMMDYLKDDPREWQKIAKTSDTDWSAFAERLNQRGDAAYQAWKAKDRCLLVIEEAPFNFRDCFNPPQVMAYDPDHLLAESDLTRYSLLHVVQNYEARYAKTRAAWLAEYGLDSEAAEAPFYALLLKQRKERLRLHFILEMSGKDREAWERRNCNAITALLGLELRVEGAVPLPRGVLDALRDTPVLCFPVRDGLEVGMGAPRNWAGLARHSCRREGIWPYELRIEWRDGEGVYVLVTGTAALLVEAEMRGALRKTVAAQGSAVIL